ncbi:putative F-box protein At1g49610 [Solanum pennellii]|uniref:F-box protein At1g49610 n=1 Tax=Solanum pennellii TaxID=28526 RepID=A0ABM1HLA9_SOLPN|nr:putative F-box protein At1g49610 [Solanum pennellii]
MRATSDILSDGLIHKILSFLSFKEATKMSILSKTWLRAWSTHPNLEFEVDYLNDNMKKVDSIIERYRDEKIPIEKFELSNASFPQENFPLFDKWLHIALQNGVKNIVFRVPCYTTYTLPVFTILAEKSLRELVLRGFDLKHVTLSSGGVANYNSLKKLSLSSICLDDNMLQTLLNRCSLIVDLVLEHCDGLENIELLNLQRIKSVTIKTFRKQRVKIDAPTLEHLYYLDAGEAYPTLDIINAPNLASLEYIGDQIPKAFVDVNLQWNCHPKKVIVFTTNEMMSRFMDRLMSMKRSKPLRNRLQQVTTYKFDWENQIWHLVEFRSGKLALTRDKFYFLLDW